MIANHYLTVQTWKRNFNPWNETICSVAVWVRLPRLPGDYYDRKFFFSLGNKIGKAIKVDEMTLRRERTMFARLCVEVDLNAPLLPSYIVDGNALKIEYEGLHLICFGCGKFGHSKEFCPARKDVTHSPPPATNGDPTAIPGGSTVVNVGGEETMYGGWMLAADPRKGKKTSSRGDRGAEQTGRSRQGEMVGGKFRFDVLREEDSGEREEGSRGGDVRTPLQNISNSLEVNSRIVGAQNKVGGAEGRERGARASERKSQGKGGDIKGSPSLKNTNKWTGGGKVDKAVSLVEERSTEVGPAVRKVGESRETKSIGQKRENNGQKKGGQKGPGQREDMVIEHTPKEDGLSQCVKITSGPVVSLNQNVSSTAPPIVTCSSSGLMGHKPPDPTEDNILMDTAEVEAVFLSREGESLGPEVEDGGLRSDHLRS